MARWHRPSSAIHYTAERGPEFFYNEREVSHMVDVRAVTAGALQVWVASLIVAVLAVIALAVWGPAGALRGALLLGWAFDDRVVFWGLWRTSPSTSTRSSRTFHKIFFA